MMVDMKRALPLALLCSAVALTCATAPASNSPCPDDAKLVGAAPPAGTEQSCVRIRRDGQAENHGAFAQWYENLKPRTVGQYRWGAKCGSWTEHPADGGAPRTTDHGPCPEAKPCQQDRDCEPPFTRCDEGYKRCVDGCYQVPCDQGFVCDAVSGDCVRDDMIPSQPQSMPSYDRPCYGTTYR